jgi:PAS domain S-box-containing protein
VIDPLIRREPERAESAVPAADDSAESLAFLAAIVESSDDAIVSKTLDGIIRYWNGGATRIFGYAPDEIIGRHITTIIPPELHDEEHRILESIRAGRRVRHFDTTRLAKGGRRIPISVTVSPIRDGAGNVIGASKIARDISDRKRSEGELRDSRRRLAAEALALVQLSEASTRLWRCHSLASGLDEILRTVIALVGAFKGNVQLLNAARNTLAIVAHHGFDAGFLATFEHVSPGDPHSACGRALATGQPVVIEDVLADEEFAAFRDAAQAAGYRSVVSVPLYAADGSTLGVISAHFVLPHRPGEAEMRRLELYCRQASDFIQRIRLEHDLRQNQEALREADRRKDEFLALLAHELRNPLAPIRYALATLRRPGLTGEQKDRAEAVVERQVAHMSRLLDDLLDISRITRGTLELKRSRTDLRSVIGSSVEAARPFLDAKSHSLALQLPDHPVGLDADPVRLAQVFSNLLINAAKYTAEGGRIELAALEDAGEIVVTVRDNGIGIAPENMAKIFTLFTQAQSGLCRAEEGLGVGLALARGLVRLHGGTLDATSEGIGRGSEFTVRLPVVEPAREPALLPAAHEPDAGPALRVLVVDDNRDAADSCATLLELGGHRVQTAYRGEHALELAESFRPNVILLDIGLPDINGYDVAHRIRSSDWGTSLALVAVTGWGQEADRRRAFEVGFDHHLTKPVAPDAIESLLGRLASGARPG